MLGAVDAVLKATEAGASAVFAASAAAALSEGDPGAVVVPDAEEDDGVWDIEAVYSLEVRRRV